MVRDNHMPDYAYSAPRLYVDAPLKEGQAVPLQRAHVGEAAEQCGILSLAEVKDPMPLERFLGQRAPERLLVFCDEAAELADPVAALKAVDGPPAGIGLLVGRGG